MVRSMKEVAKKVKAKVVKPLGQRRLEKLIKKMEKVPKEHFNMDVWVSHKGDARIRELHGRPLEQIGESAEDLLDCGTQACAFGWACTIPEFRKAGLYLAYDEYWNKSVVIFKDEEGRLWRGGRAGAEFFQNPYIDGLFLPAFWGNGETPEGWVKRAKEWLESNKQHFRI